MNNSLLWRPYDPAYIRDPYSMYKQLREKDPVHLAQTHEYIITRYHDIREILKSNSFQAGNRLAWFNRGIHYFENKEEDFRAISEAMSSFILMLNAPDHGRIRNFVMKSWDDRQVDEMIRENVGRLLSSFESDTLDIVSDFAQSLPVLTISRILGIPTADYKYLKDLGITMTKALDLYISLKEMVMINDASKKFISFFQEQIKQKSDQPDQSLLGKMIARNRNEKTGLTESELISIAIFLFIAGEETSARLISSGVYALLTNPQEFEKLKANESLMESAIEEMLRYDSVVHLLGRIAKENYHVGGVDIPEGATVTLVIASANRDELVFENADKFDIERSPNRHLAFGSGVHFCLGDWLAKKQAQIAINALIKRYSNIQLAPQEISWYNNLAIRSMRSLKLIVRD
jgi:pimeloyl-[acyl-carrier protein] synthase